MNENKPLICLRNGFSLYEVPRLGYCYGERSDDNINTADVCTHISTVERNYARVCTIHNPN